MQRAFSRNSASCLPGRRVCAGSPVGVCGRRAEEQELQRVARFPRAPPGRRGSEAMIFVSGGNHQRADGAAANQHK